MLGVKEIMDTLDNAFNRSEMTFELKVIDMMNLRKYKFLEIVFIDTMKIHVMYQL